MNLCFAIGSLSYSGAEKIMSYLIRELKKRGHQISVLLIARDKEYEDFVGIKQYPIYDLKEESGKNKFVRTYKRQRRIKKIVRENNFDAIISFGVRYNLDVMQACLGQNVKVILCERNDPIHDPASRLLRIRRKVIYRKADAFVFQTEDIKAFFDKKIQKRAVVIPNFIEKRILKEDVCTEKRDSFVTCGRLDNNQKNQEELIKTFYEFQKINGNYKLEFYGEGPDRERYELLIKELGMQEKIILHGRVENPIEEIRKCKFFIFSSKYEGMPNALIEAMACGMACIATDCSGGGARALIKNRINGMLVQYNNQKQMLDAMFELSSDYTMSKRLGDEAYKINDTLEMTKIVDLWEKFIRSRCDER